MRTVIKGSFILILLFSSLFAAQPTYKSVLFIRIDFSDKPGEAITVEKAKTLIDETVSTFFLDNSNGRIAFKATVTEKVLRMPNPSKDYTGSKFPTKLRTDAYNLANPSGSYDFYIYAFPKIGFGWSGLNGSNWVCLNNNFSLGVVAHELGHGFGFGHANTWKVVDGKPNTEGRPASVSKEYGNKFDVMGGGRRNEHHFNTMFKHDAGWISDEEAPLITTSGKFRIYAHDKRNSKGLRAIRVSHGKPEGEYDYEYIYWIEFRDAINSDALRNGAVISYQRKLPPGIALIGGPSNYLLDMTPETNTHNDHPLAVGKSFRDDNGKFTIKVVSRIEGAVPALDVQILFDGSPLISGSDRILKPVMSSLIYSKDNSLVANCTQPGLYHLNLTNATGQQVASYPLSGETTSKISLEQLGAGFYLARLIDGANHSVTTKSFIIPR